MNLGTPGATKVLGIVGLVAVVGLGWVLAIGPQTAQLSDAREQVAATRDSNDNLTVQLTALQKQAKQLGETRTVSRKLSRKFPATADQPGLFEQVTTAAVDAGIGAKGVTTLAPTPPSLGDGGAAATQTSGQTLTPASGVLARQTVTVTVTGSYDQTQQLLVDLEHMQRAYLISSVALAGNSDDGAYTTTITGDMFVMSPVADPDTSTQKAGSSTNDPEE